MKQEKILKYIKEYIEKNEFSPSFREIASKMNMPVSSVAFELKSMKEKGIITYIPKISRTIRIIDK